MTAQEIADRLLHDPSKGITKERVQKLIGLCRRSKVEIQTVLDLLPSDIQQQIADTAN